MSQPTIETTWNAWQEEPCILHLPAKWTVHHYRLPATPPLALSACADLIGQALSAPWLQSRLTPGQTVCVVVDDHTRPAAWGPVLRILLDELRLRGITADSVTILMGLAGHAPMTPAELAWKLGAENMRRVRVVQHTPLDGCRAIDFKGQAVSLNRQYLDAGFKIALGTIIPHPFAGFSGGGKAIMPGVAGLETTRKNHALLSFGNGRVFDTGHTVRRQMDDIAEASGLDLLINAVVNSAREIVHLSVGPLRPTFQSGLNFARGFTSTPIHTAPDVLILNAYPKDRELLQVNNALNVARTMTAEHAARCGALVLVARATTGVGFHALFGPGGSLYKPSGPPPGWKEKVLLCYSPQVTTAEFHQVFSTDWLLCSQWSQVVARLHAMLPGAGIAACFHQASMQTAHQQ